MIMFESVNSMDELKKEYRKLAFQYHPDRGGDAEMMKKVNAAYETALKKLQEQAKNENVSASQSSYFEDDGFRDILNKIIHLDLDIEICWRWIWVSGNTRAHKETLKNAGFYWASKKKMWYWRPEDAKVKYSTGITDMDYIRNMYGSEKIQTKTRRRAAIEGR